MKLDRRTFIAAGGASMLFPRNAFADIKEHEAALYDAAKKEGEMTWYIAHYTSETSERFGRTFTEKYPGVRINVIRSTAQVAFQRLAKDLQSQVANCDLFASTDLGHYVYLKEKDLLQPFDPKNAEFIQKEFRRTDPDNLFHTTSATFVSLLYNTNKVKAEEAPKVWRDLLDPKWANQVSVGHPGFSGFVGTWVVQMKKLYGWKYFEDLAKLKPQIGRSIIDTVTMLAWGSAASRRARGRSPICRPRAATRSGSLRRGWRRADGLAVRHHEERQASERRQAVHRVPLRPRGCRHRRRRIRDAAPKRR